jgi:hypothetical protein
MEKETPLERAKKISDRIDELHDVLNDLYEDLVDKNLERAEADIKYLIFDLKVILKSMTHEDF